MHLAQQEAHLQLAGMAAQGAYATHAAPDPAIVLSLWRRVWDKAGIR